MADRPDTATAIDHGGIVVGNVDRVGDVGSITIDLLTLLLLDRDLLLLGRLQLVVGLRLRRSRWTASMTSGC